MCAFVFHETSHMDPITESCYSFVKSVKNAAPIHTHDFFEFFLVTEGRVLHRVNSAAQRLPEGALVLIRPWDTHYYDHDGESDGQFINIPYTKKAIEDAFAYLGSAFNPERLLCPAVPPMVKLPPFESTRLKGRLEKLFTLPSNQRPQLRIELRSILVEVLTKYFPNYQLTENSGYPLWFESVLMKVQEKEVFTEGLSSLCKLSDRSPGHINRCFKRYLNTTPTEFINGLRLNYAKNLLTNTDMEILDISLEAGFNNLSHFYHLFKKSTGSSPAVYRETSGKFLV